MKYQGWFLSLQLLFTAVTFWVFIREAATKHQTPLWVGPSKRQVVFGNTSKQPPSLGAPRTLVKLLLHKHGEMINRNQPMILVQPGSVRPSKDVSQGCSSLSRVKIRELWSWQPVACLQQAYSRCTSPISLHSASHMCSWTPRHLNSPLKFPVCLFLYLLSLLYKQVFLSNVALLIKYHLLLSLQLNSL